MDNVLPQMAARADMNILIFLLKARLQGCVKSSWYRLDGEVPHLRDLISAAACGNMQYHAPAANLLFLYADFQELVVFC